MRSSDRGGPGEAPEVNSACLLDARQVAEMIGMRVDYIYALCRRDQIPHLTFGRTRRFRLGAIQAWLADRERGSA